MAEAARAQPTHGQDDCSTEAAHGLFCWNERMTRDVERAKAFYRDTIGWTFEPATMPDGRIYWIALQSGKPAAGLFPLDAPQFDGVPESWSG